MGKSYSAKALDNIVQWELSMFVRTAAIKRQPLNTTIHSNPMIKRVGPTRTSLPPSGPPAAGMSLSMSSKTIKLGALCFASL